MRKNRADPVHIMKSCSAFASHGVQVSLVTPSITRKDWKVERTGIWNLYQIKPNFNIIELPTRLGDNTPGFIVWFQKFLFFSIFFSYLLIKRCITDEKPVIYSKCYISTLPAVLIKQVFRNAWPIFFEKADFSHSKWIHEYICNNVDGIIAINQYIGHKILENYNIDESRVFINGFYSFIDDFMKINFKKNEAREKLNLPLDLILVVYSGKMDEKMTEIHYIIDAAKDCPEKIFVLVGGRDPVIRHYEKVLAKEDIDNVILRGFQPLENIFLYSMASDVLLSYYDSNDFSAFQRVPAKLAVYICAKRPVIVADLPSMRYFLNEKQVFFVSPDKPSALAQMIDYVIDHPIESDEKVSELYDYAQNMDLSSYAGRTLDFINRTIGSH